MTSALDRIEQRAQQRLSGPERYAHQQDVLALVNIARAAQHIVYPFAFDPTEVHCDWHGSELHKALALLDRPNNTQEQG